MTSNNFINAEIPVSNRREAELAAKKAEELGYKTGDKLLNYKGSDKYLTLNDDGCYGFWSFKDEIPITPLSEFLNQPQTETITLENGEKWRVKLIEKVQEEPMSAEKFLYSKRGVTNAPRLMVLMMKEYAQYRLEFEREKQTNDPTHSSTHTA